MAIRTNSKIAIVDLDIITSLGEGVHSLWNGLMEGRRGISINRRFFNEFFISNYVALVDGINYGSEESILFQLLKKLYVRYSKKGINDIDLLIVATTVGEVDLLEKCKDPEDVLNEKRISFDVLLDRCCNLFNIPHGMVVSAACASSTIAIINAFDLISTGKANSVMVIGVDGVSEFILSGFSAIQALDSKIAKPFDSNRAGLTVGEGVGYVILRRLDSDVNSKDNCYGYIISGGIASDANHMTGPSRDGDGLKRAVRDALLYGGVASEDVAFISAHGTGTVYNDLMEMKAFSSIFHRPVPTFSIKGAIGHTMGASGLIEVVISLKALHEGKIPATVGTTHVMDEARNWVSTFPQDISSTVALSCNSGFGGINAAILLEKGGRNFN